MERQRGEGGPSSGVKQESSREAAWRMTATHAWALVAAGRMRKVVLLCCILEGLSADLPALMASFTPPTISCTGLSAVTGMSVTLPVCPSLPPLSLFLPLSPSLPLSLASPHASSPK